MPCVRWEGGGGVWFGFLVFVEAGWFRCEEVNGK